MIFNQTNNIMLKLKIKFKFILFSTIFVALFTSSVTVFADTCFWTNTANDDDWFNGANWENGSGFPCAAVGGVPDADDEARFDGGGDALGVGANKDLTIPESVTDLNVLQVTPDYDAILTAPSNLDIEANLFLFGGEFIAPSGNLNIGSSFSLFSGGSNGVFTHNNGTVIIDNNGLTSGGFNTSISLILTSIDFYDLVINKTSSTSTDVTISGGNMTVENSLTLSSGRLQSSGNSLTVLDGATVNWGEGTTTSGFRGGTAEIILESDNISGTLNIPASGASAAVTGLTINNPALTVNTNASDIYFVEDFELQQGLFDNAVDADLEFGPSSSFLQTGGTFRTGENTTIFFDSSAVHELNDASGSTTAANFIGETGTTLQFDGTFRIDDDFPVDSGPIFNGTDLTLLDINRSLSLDLQDGVFLAPPQSEFEGTINVEADSTFTHNSGTLTFNGGFNGTLNFSPSAIFYNVILDKNSSANSLSTANDPIIIENDFTITSGILQKNSSIGLLDVDGDLLIDANGEFRFTSNASMSVAGNWTNNGIFTPGQSTVDFDGGTQSINGDNTFYNIIKNVSSESSLIFDSNSTQTFSNSMDFQGSSDNTRLLLRSSTEGERAQIDAPDSNRIIAWLDVKDNENIDAVEIDASGTNSLTNGNNIGWINLDIPPSVVPEFSTYLFILTTMLGIGIIYRKNLMLKELV